MQKDYISRREPSQSHSSLRSVPFQKVLSSLLYIFVAVSAMVIFVPLNPRMPGKGLDASWEFAMNEAVARQLNFGKQVMFTYGPYAAIGTRTYSPATDRRMMWGSLFVAASYLAGLFYLARGKKRLLIFTLLVFFAMFGNPELLLLSYSFLLAACALKYLNPDDGRKPTALNWRQMVAAAVMWSTLGLLPLVKGSLLLPFAASAAIPAALFVFHRRFKEAIVLFLLPIVSAAGLWVYAGQPLENLPSFLHGTFELTSGYTEAMSSSWLILPGIIGDGLVLIFLVLSALMFWSVRCSNRFKVISKWTLLAVCAVFLLVIFKHAFVKADAVSGAFPAFAAIALIVGFLQMDRWLIWSMTLAIFLTAATSVMQDTVLLQEVHEKFGSGVTWGGQKRTDIFAYCAERAGGAYLRTTLVNPWKAIDGAWGGLRLRMGHGNLLEERFARALDDIRSSDPLPALKGSVDAYEYDQSALLASNNEWNPRPVFQSYSVYTPDLARMNEQHLRGKDAPDWVLFDLQSVGGRYPALDDGLSWPALLDNYSFASNYGQFALLRRNPTIHAYSEYGSTFRQTCKTGSTITLPAIDGPLFAEVDLKPTLAGRVLIALFNPPVLHIVVGLRNEKTVRYRTVSNMMKTDFLLSPMVSNTKDVASLMSGGKELPDEDKVETISISPSYGGSLLWSDTYSLTLKKYAGFGK
jgi:hypothetical protein